MSTVRLHQATYVYIPYRFYAPYNANKSIFVYPHGIFNIYIYICCHGYIINNNNHHGFFINIYIYIYICPPIFYLYVYINISICFFTWYYYERPSHSQCVINRLPHAAHTTSLMITFCNASMRFNQSKKFNIFTSNVFDMVAYNCNT